jgi:hypothetical protein
MKLLGLTIYTPLYGENAESLRFSCLVYLQIKEIVCAAVFVQNLFSVIYNLDFLCSTCRYFPFFLFVYMFATFSLLTLVVRFQALQ